MLLDQEALDRSPVVANTAMNRERRLHGTNSYARELGIDPLDFGLGIADCGLEREFFSVAKRPVPAPVAPFNPQFRWLDLCCGTGRALIQAAAQITAQGIRDRVEMVGVDLVDHFDPVPPGLSGLRLVTGSLPGWKPGAASFHLITCVHGLHYVGDKLEAIRQAVSWLSETGLFLAHLDPASFRFPDGKPAARTVLRELRRNGLEYCARTHRLTCRGRRQITFPCEYRGARDTAGPNYTAQPGVDSFYALPE